MFEAVLKAGDLLDGKWRIEGLLGEGGMGAVYAARHLRNGREVALKLLHPAVAADRAARERFLQEGYAANQVDHPGAVQVLDDGVCHEGVFLVMERLRGASIESVAERRGDRLDLLATLSILDAALEIVDAAHQKGMVHRDLKPENLFLTEQGALKVLDFGLARVRQSESGVKLTATGVPMGTPAFMPPEQSLAHWDEVDASSDVFALGASAYTLLSGQLVHPARSAPEMLVMASTRQARSIRHAVPQVPPAIAEVIDRALAFDRHQRYRDAGAMRAALRAALARSGVTLPSLASLGLLQPGSVIAAPDTAEVSSDALRTVPAITPSMQQPTPEARAISARVDAPPDWSQSGARIAVQGAAGRAAPPQVIEPGPTETVAPITSDRGRSRAGSVAAVSGVAALVGVAAAVVLFRSAPPPEPTSGSVAPSSSDAAPVGSPAEVQPGAQAPTVTPTSSGAPSASQTASAASSASVQAVDASARPPSTTARPSPKPSGKPAPQPSSTPARPGGDDPLGEYHGPKRQ